MTKGKGKVKEIEYIDFDLFDIKYGYVGGAFCRIARHLVLQALKGRLSKKELNYLQKK